MTALDQAFIKAYLQQAGGKKASLEASEKAGHSEPKPESPPRSLSAHDSSDPQVRGLGEASGPTMPIHRLSDQALGADKGVQLARPNHPTPDTDRSPPSGIGSQQPSPSAVSEKKATSGKKSASRSLRVSLVETLNPQEEQPPVGLPNRRTLQQLASVDSQAGPPPPALVPRPHFLSPGKGKRSLQQSFHSPSSSWGGETSSDTSAPFTEAQPSPGPECVLDFTGSPEPNSLSDSAEVGTTKKPKLPKNPRKITFCDLEIPREVCFFEPPSPTIPFHGDREGPKVRGRPELARPSSPPRLSLFAPESVPEASSEAVVQMAVRGTPGSASASGRSSSSEKSSGEIATARRLQLHRPPEGASVQGPQKSATGAGSPRPMPADASSPAGAEEVSQAVSPHWRVAQLHWPRVCLALEAKAAAALDRVAGAILSAAGEGKKVFGFVSLRAGEGATTLLLCAARRLAERGYRLLLADANLQHPDLAEQLNLAPQVTWEQAAEGLLTLQEVLIESPTDGITILPRNSSSRSKADRLAGYPAEIGRGLNQLRPLYDVILVDMGVLDHVAEALALEEVKEVGLVEGLVMVRNVRGQTVRTELANLRQRFQTAGIPVIGIVDNCV